MADILLEILYTGAIGARMAGWAGDGKKAAIEADHIHNIPHLIKDYSLHRLKWYWEAERESYVKQLGGQPKAFEALWEQLEPLVKKELERVDGTAPEQAA
ncbi:MAG: hypothetical protein JO250_09900 [Armatimonadetes bacterium]|nr:hypothetical protein [Armatimonadota bacterium]